MRGPLKVIGNAIQKYIDEKSTYTLPTPLRMEMYERGLDPDNSTMEEFEKAGYSEEYIKGWMYGLLHSERRKGFSK